MINFIENNESEPYVEFRNLYQKALNKGQEHIEAVCISSYDPKINEVQSRFVNLKYIKNEEWIFFSNYDSPKALSFKLHDQITSTFFWNSTYTQVRIKAKIYKTDKKFSDMHFNNRSVEKNALAISSTQSKKISSYEEVIKNYDETLKNFSSDTERPIYWGGFSFRPFYFEFWHGNNKRLNKRTVYEQNKNLWVKYYLQP
tara:strand:- start:512 stop:1111 length:600 start_codon:yes stop_codon:yes gene_type:complete